MYTAQDTLSGEGIWAELSSAAAFAGLAYAPALGLEEGPLVVINTSSGFKDINIGLKTIIEIDDQWASLQNEMKKSGLL